MHAVVRTSGSEHSTSLTLNSNQQTNKQTKNETARKITRAPTRLRSNDPAITLVDSSARSMAAKVASPLAFRRDVRGPLGRPHHPGGCRSGTGTGLPGVLYWSSGAGGSRVLAARARGRNRFGGGGRGATKDDAAEEDEEEAADVVIVDAGDDEEYASDELSGFRGLVLDLSYR